MKDEFINFMRVYWDEIHGVTQVSIFTNTGYFETIGKLIERRSVKQRAKGYMEQYYENVFRFSKDDQLIGMYASLSDDKTDPKVGLERIGVIKLNT